MGTRPFLSQLQAVTAQVFDEKLHSTDGRPELIRIIQDEITASQGSIPFSRFMELALYHPRFGYYLSSERRPGRGGDFITSPEISPYFGHTLARQMAECWDRLGQPSAWSIREYGAGIGGLAYDLMAGLDQESPRAFDALTYRLAELNPAMRAEATQSMRQAGLGGKVVAEEPTSGSEPIAGVVLANEVADAFPAVRLMRRDGTWLEAYVATDAGHFSWHYRRPSAVADMVLRNLEADDVSLPDGSVLDAIPAASSWFAAAVSQLDRGYAMVIDYGYPARELYRDHRMAGTIRGYQGHTVTDDPLIRVGLQDLTAHVDFTALQRAGEAAGMRPEGLTTQGAMLSSLDLGDVLLRLQEDPDVSMQEYMATQAVVLRLIDPGGLGRFGVLIMSKGIAENDVPLRAFRDAPPRF